MKTPLQPISAAGEEIHSKEAIWLLQTIDLLKELTIPAATRGIPSDVRARARALLNLLPPPSEVVRWEQRHLDQRGD